MILEDTIRAILREKGQPMPFSILALDVMAKLPEMTFYDCHDALNDMLQEQTVKITEEGKYTI